MFDDIANLWAVFCIYLILSGKSWDLRKPYPQACMLGRKSCALGFNSNAPDCWIFLSDSLAWILQWKVIIDEARTNQYSCCALLTKLF